MFAQIVVYQFISSRPRFGIVRMYIVLTNVIMNISRIIGVDSLIRDGKVV